ncbi:hypothetical protein H4R35_004844 [Dimargaris xerosporica]|nr:hypothetical protein H4R35_004844 [Dimargaris xerosporica]
MTTTTTSTTAPNGTSTTASRVAVRPARGAKDLALCLQVRIAVFVDEQGFPLAIENDELDATCHHILAYLPKPSAAQASSADVGPVLAPLTASAPPLPSNNTSCELAPSNGQVTEAGHQLPADEQPVGTLRMYECGPGVGKIGRVAVLPSHRSLGIGRLLMNAAHRIAARELGWHKAVVHSQCDKAGFYAKLGYTSPDPTVYMEEGCPHITMERALTGAEAVTASPALL